METFNPGQIPNQPLKTEKNVIGPIIAIIIILTLIIMGGLYFLKMRIEEKNDYTPSRQGVREDEIVNSLRQQNTSDNLEEIERDLNKSNFENLDQDAQTVESRINN